MNYTLNQLRIFVEVVRKESITKAAEALHLTQPAVSIQLKNFQHQFDIPLTELINKKLYITDFGREIAVAAENLLNEAYAISYRTMAYKGKMAGRLRISAASTGKYVIPYFLADFLKQHDEIELELDVTNKSRVVESLEKNEVDFALVSALPENLALRTIVLMENKLFLVGNQPLPEATGFDSSMHILSSIPLIYREYGSATRLAMETFIAEHALEVHKKIVLTSNEAVKQAVIAGLGYSIMPLIGIKNELLNGQLQILPLQGLPIASQWNLVWLSEKRNSPVASAYIDFVNREKERIIAMHFGWLGSFAGDPSFSP